MEIDEIKRNTAAVLRRVERAAAGRRVTVVAATKTVPPEQINAAIASGITSVGENRVQEYIAKKDAVACAERHFIGTLQRNKAKYLVGDATLIQSVDGMGLAREISRLAGIRGVTQRVLIEVNAADEPSKSGVSKREFDALLRGIRELDGIAVCGIMSVPPIGASDAVYRELYAIFAANRGGEFDTLSVGMSADYEKAIEFGSSMVRIGSAIFGKRQ